MSPVGEQLVEGHTVFAVLEVYEAENQTKVEFAAAVAVLVQESEVERRMSRFPGVLWFNDQFLVQGVDSSGGGSRDLRRPCTGAVMAVNSGDADPRVWGVGAYNAATYVESYLITDPNDHLWNIDKWRINGSLVWSVALLDNQQGYNQSDDGECNASTYTDRRCSEDLVEGDSYCRFAGSAYAFAPAAVPGSQHRRTGEHGMDYPCDGCRGIEYNALLYFLLEDLEQPGVPKDHREGSSDWQNDASGCHSPSEPESLRTWPCPDGDDAREGNSHPYNPGDVYLFKNYAGYRNHGGSADCDGDATGDRDCHATRFVDLYYGAVEPPPLREYRVVDLPGSNAPYHCHDDMACTGDDRLEGDDPPDGTQPPSIN